MDHKYDFSKARTQLIFVPKCLLGFTGALTLFKFGFSPTQTQLFPFKSCPLYRSVFIVKHYVHDKSSVSGNVFFLHNMNKEYVKYVAISVPLL